MLFGFLLIKLLKKIFNFINLFILKLVSVVFYEIVFI